MRRRYGHLRGIEHASDKKLVGLVRATTRPSAVSWASRVDRVRDQGSLSCCEGMAWSAAVALRAAILGTPIQHPSALALYALARELDQGADPLKDEGTYARSIAAALASGGIVTEDEWPLVESKVNVRLPWDLVQRGSDSTLAIGDAFWIRSTGATRTEDLRMALAAGFPVTMGINVSKAFEDGEWDVYDGDPGPSLGGHCIMACGFSPKGIMCLNSWGPTWGRKGGFFWLSDRFVGSDDASDLCMVQIAPKEIE